MCEESLIRTEVTNPAFPELDAQEGAKFATLARRVAPPNIIAEYIQEKVGIYPIIAELQLENTINAFGAIFNNTAKEPRISASGIKLFSYTPTDSYNYFKHCAKDPTLFLSCFYLSLALQVYVNDLNQMIKDPQMSSSIAGFGRQFNNIQLVTALPMALCTSLTRIHGESANATLIAKDVIISALNSLHDNGQFAIRAKGMARTQTQGREIVIQCPMEGYLFELLGRNEVLQPIIAATCRLNRELQTSKPVNANETLPSPQVVIHQINVESVKYVAKQILCNFQHAT